MCDGTPCPCNLYPPLLTPAEARARSTRRMVIVVGIAAVLGVAGFAASYVLGWLPLIIESVIFVGLWVAQWSGDARDRARTDWSAR